MPNEDTESVIPPAISAVKVTEAVKPTSLTDRLRVVLDKLPRNLQQVADRARKLNDQISTIVPIDAPLSHRFSALSAVSFSELLANTGQEEIPDLGEIIQSAGGIGTGLVVFVGLSVTEQLLLGEMYPKANAVISFGAGVLHTAGMLGQEKS